MSAIWCVAGSAGDARAQRRMPVFHSRPAEIIGRLADRYQALPSMLYSRTPEAGSATAASYGAHRTYAYAARLRAISASPNA